MRGASTMSTTNKERESNPEADAEARRIRATAARVLLAIAEGREPEVDDVVALAAFVVEVVS
jgi:hypothetical protein